MGFDATVQHLLDEVSGKSHFEVKVNDTWYVIDKVLSQIKTYHPFGRGTRVMLAHLKNDSGKSVILKDLWVGTDTEGEGHFLRILRHRIDKLGLQLDTEGFPYVPQELIEKVLGKEGMQLTPEEWRIINDIHKEIPDVSVESLTSASVLARYARKVISVAKDDVASEPYSSPQTDHPMAYFLHMVEDEYVPITSGGEDQVLSVMLRALNVDELKSWGGGTHSSHLSGERGLPVRLPTGSTRPSEFYSRRHYRIVFSEVCVGLEEMDDPTSMYSTSMHATKGMPRHPCDRCFFAKVVIPGLMVMHVCGMEHCDISASSECYLLLCSSSYCLG
jgi:hypothetical protein